MWYLYILRCADNSLYTGITLDLKRRLAEHQAQGPKCARYLRGRAPLEMVYHTKAGTHSKAASLETRVKKLPKAEKELLVSGKLKLTSVRRKRQNYNISSKRQRV
ncbi:MAG: GIY-YIG nuclease family protein [Candidatus Margulisiibacteriota bacterium]|jgi:putative endonuclease